MAQSQNQTLLDFLDRRHPEYAEMLLHWLFLESTYEGGRGWFAQGNIFKYVKEGQDEYNNRVARCYRFNHTRECTDLVQKYIFKSKVARNEKDAPQEIKDFWNAATLSGLDINQFMKLVSTKSSIGGMPWIFTDTTQKPGAVSVADAKKNKARVYAYIVKPQDVLDVGYSDIGELLWVKVREIVRDDDDPIRSSGELRERYRLWTKTDWTAWEIDTETKGNKIVRKVRQVGHEEHGLDRVPGFPVPHVIGENKYSAPALINDIAYLDRAIANYLSNLDAIIQDQTFSQLAMPAQGIIPGTDPYQQLLEMGTKRIFTYDAEGGVKPEFLSPDPKQANVILQVINKIVSEIYHTIGMAGERTKDDNAAGIDNSSGVAKAYDFDRMNSLLTSKASSLENAENELCNLVMAWHSKANAIKEELVKYPETFDVRSLFDEFTIAERLALVDAPETVRQEQMKQVIDKLFPRLSEDLKAKMMADVAKWPPEPEPEVSPALKTPGPKLQGKSRQGQVTKATPGKQ